MDHRLTKTNIGVVAEGPQKVGLLVFANVAINPQAGCGWKPSP